MALSLLHIGLILVGVIVLLGLIGLAWSVGLCGEEKDPELGQEAPLVNPSGGKHVVSCANVTTADGEESPLTTTSNTRNLIIQSMGPATLGTGTDTEKQGLNLPNSMEQSASMGVRPRPPDTATTARRSTFRKAFSHSDGHTGPRRSLSGLIAEAAAKAAQTAADAGMNTARALPSARKLVQRTPSMSRRNSEPAREYSAITLDRLLADPLGLKLFKDHLRQSFSEENLDFFFAVRFFDPDARRLPGLKVIQKIYDEYIKPGGPKEITVLFDRQSRITEEVEACQAGDQTTSKALIEAIIVVRNDIYQLLENDLMRRFLDSEKGADWIAGNASGGGKMERFASFKRKGSLGGGNFDF